MTRKSNQKVFCYNPTTLKKVYEFYSVSQALETVLKNVGGYDKILSTLHREDITYEGLLYSMKEYKPRNIFSILYRIIFK